MSIEDIKARIADCQSYNFGMRNADKLAHEDAPKLVAALEAVQNVSDDLMRGAFFEESEMSEDILAGQRSAALNVFAAIRAAFDG